MTADLDASLATVAAHLDTPVDTLRRNLGLTPDNATPTERAAAGTRLAATRWTTEQVTAVDNTITHLAARKATFTTDDVWDALGPGFPVTKGIAGRLIAARNRDIIAPTGRTVLSSRGNQHDHGQRLTVWQSLTHPTIQEATPVTVTRKYDNLTPDQRAAIADDYAADTLSVTTLLLKHRISNATLKAIRDEYNLEQRPGGRPRKPVDPAREAKRERDRLAYAAAKAAAAGKP